MVRKKRYVVAGDSKEDEVTAGDSKDDKAGRGWRRHRE
jgi:hypothetical protein